MNKHIARIRKERGLTQKELAEKIGIASTLISDYERGKLRLYDELIVKMAEVFEISTDQLLGMNGQPQNENQPSRRVMRRLHDIEALPEPKRKVILKTLDDLIKANS